MSKIQLSNILSIDDFNIITWDMYSLPSGYLPGTIYYSEGEYASRLFSIQELKNYISIILRFNPLEEIPQYLLEEKELEESFIRIKLNYDETEYCLNEVSLVSAVGKTLSFLCSACDVYYRPTIFSTESSYLFSATIDNLESRVVTQLSKHIAQIFPNSIIQVGDNSIYIEYVFKRCLPVNIHSLITRVLTPINFRYGPKFTFSVSGILLNLTSGENTVFSDTNRTMDFMFSDVESWDYDGYLPLKLPNNFILDEYSDLPPNIFNYKL